MTRLPTQIRLLALVGFCCLGIAGTTTAQATDLSGCWEGRWSSCSTGHAGPLQATFCRRSATQYEVEFRGRFFKFIPFRYRVTLDVVADDGQSVELAGRSYLGKLFGTFHYQAAADHCTFVADYTSGKDAGRFTMRRVGCERKSGLRTLH